MNQNPTDESVTMRINGTTDRVSSKTVKPSNGEVDTPTCKKRLKTNTTGPGPDIASPTTTWDSDSSSALTHSDMSPTPPTVVNGSSNSAPTFEILVDSDEGTILGNATPTITNKRQKRKKVLHSRTTPEGEADANTPSHGVVVNYGMNPVEAERRA